MRKVPAMSGLVQSAGLSGLIAYVRKNFTGKHIHVDVMTVKLCEIYELSVPIALCTTTVFPVLSFPAMLLQFNAAPQIVTAVTPDPWEI